MVARFRFIPLAAAFAAALCSNFAFASTEEARRLLNEGRAAQALNVLEKHLEGSPQDAEARFLRGLALSRTGRRDQAIDVFSNLTRDYPQLPEPYNNLAVIYAQQGDYEKARDALEAALATHPSYATAHENLGDIYAALASASYNRALMLEADNQSARQKLKLMERLGASMPAARPNLTASASAPAGDQGESGTTETASNTDTDTEAASTPAASPQSQPQPAAASAPSPAAERARRERISAAVYDWAQAWQNQNVETYLDAYAPDFSPAGGLSRSAWEAQRRERVSSPDRIQVRIRDPDIQVVNPDRARVTFKQEYESDTYSDVTTKVLDLRRAGNRWLILRETTR